VESSSAIILTTISTIEDVGDPGIYIDTIEQVFSRFEQVDE
jgi:hypothetical protein